MTGLPVGIGVDLVEIDRLRSLLGRHPGVRQRLFTEQELAACVDRADAVPGLAARFAAKEAVGKALGSGVTVWREIEVVGGGRTAPVVQLHGSAADTARRRGVVRVELSLSHTAAQAVAVAVALVEAP